MVATSIPAIPPESIMAKRITRGNRHLWYRLEVVQQPERARACGAGPKSSADRRPVDPPPVVELRIFEGPTVEQAKDITFTYNANFFLFATLEHARVIAHGRVQAPSAATPPVLTGMPVSGMAYLDRPQEAGYFLFPDLSVRHEGRYRLTFNLYEQTKETGDLDKDSAEMAESFDWRMEVKSNDFTVYSAKKFPGLTESTALSRTVAEQGCRVRIRRDVRMRRREGKSAAVAAAAAAASGASADVRGGDDEYARRHRTQTPEVVAEYRARSLSIESVSRTPYVSANDVQRRPSMSEYHHPAPSPQSGPPSMLPAFSSGSGAQTPNSNHLRFGGPHPTYQQPNSSVPPSPTYTSPSHVSHPHSHSHSHAHPSHASLASHGSYAQPSPPPQQHTHHHSASSFSVPSPASSQAPPPPSQSPYYHQDRPASQHYGSAAPTPLSIPGPSPVAGAMPSPRRDSLNSVVDYQRRMSTASYTTAPPLPSSSTHMSVDSMMSSSSSSRPSMAPLSTSPSGLCENKTTLPPLSEMIASFGNKDQQPRTSIGSGHSLDRVPSLSQLLLPQPVLPPLPSGSASAAAAAAAAAAAGKKRSYGQYHNMGAMADVQTGASIKNHARQSESVPVSEYENLWWKRADGTVWSARGELPQQTA
ncbi:sexual development activator [Grosmannia clavigera kw1407]|uniref:Sexual development activator n=1 Tax=Grosmannia clavigera (strain kw1407 / UAMH 11150) TaxID=655863 RepID=F0XTL3_GROCL|nr:sexual development activator [Grosmannia clavigera kw1407]EFW98941.1 sexual development activator [Grosmannia clavigera kw1407]